MRTQEKAEAVLVGHTAEEARTQYTTAVGWLRPRLTVRARFLIAALFIYFAIISGVLVSSDFIPYVTDNNESFSTLFHARNILRFGLWSTAGLTDEVNSDDPAAHPYVYTHEGNFPRFPVLGLTFLGINRVEWQITILALLVGGLSTYLGYRIFLRIGGDLFAFLAIAVLSTDYLMYAQWQVNTFRVWHALFLFVILWCVQEINEENKLRIGAVLFLNSVCLFYFEIVFALFTAVFSGIYAVILYRSRPARMMWVLGCIVLGGMVALGLLLGQMIGHLGIAKAWEDIRLTYPARSFGDASGGPQTHAQKLHFFMQNHIVFWASTFDSNGFLNIPVLLDTVRHGIAKVYTPFLTMLGGIVSLSLLLSYGMTGRGVAGLYRNMRGQIIVQTLRSSWGYRWRLSLGAFCAILGIWGVARLGLYSLTHISLWAGVIRNQVNGALELILGLSLLWGVLLLSSGHQYLCESMDESIRGITKYLLSGCAAFVVTYAAFPSYMWNGYLARYAPIPVFIVDVWLAMVFYILLMLACRVGRVVSGVLGTITMGGGNRPTVVGRKGLEPLAALCVVSIVLLLFITGYWANLQVTYFTKLPPTAILFMRQLSRREFKLASFVSDNYALPIAYFTGRWAYQDRTLPENLPQAIEDGVGLSISGEYIWFADRDSNESYLHPQYYLCRMNPDWDIALALTALPVGERLANCSRQSLVRAAQARTEYPFRNTLLTSDPTPSDMWAIVKLHPGIRLIPRD